LQAEHTQSSALIEYPRDVYIAHQFTNSAQLSLV
jgi:hypothetical protein